MRLKWEEQKDYTAFMCSNYFENNDFLGFFPWNWDEYFIDCKLVWKIRKVPYINRKFHTFQSSICMLGLDATQFFIHNIESFQKLPHEMFNNNSYRVELIKYYINFSTSVGFFCFLFPQCPEARQLFFPDGIIHEQIIFWLPKYHG